MDLDYAAPQLFVPDVTRALGQALVMTPLAGDRDGWHHGDRCGRGVRSVQHDAEPWGRHWTAAVETFFTKREQYHSFIINQHVSLLQPSTRHRLASMQQYFMAHGMADPAAAMHQAIIVVGQTIRAQATVMSYSDCFGLLGVAVLGAIFSIMFLRKGAASARSAH